MALTKLKIESVCSWVEPDIVLVFYSENSKSLKSVLSGGKMKEEREEKLLKSDLLFSDPEFVSKLKKKAEYSS